MPNRRVQIRRALAAWCVLCLVFFQGCAGVIAAELITGTVTRVSDGDTIVVETAEGTKLRCRLAYIDAPEIPHGRAPGQPFGDEAKNALSEKILRKTVTVKIESIDRYRRMVAVIYLDSRNINLEMVREGLAEAYTEYIKNPAIRLQYINAERHARSENIGIWSLNGHERPQDYRKRMRLR